MLVRRDSFLLLSLSLVSERLRGFVGIVSQRRWWSILFFDGYLPNVPLSELRFTGYGSFGLLFIEGGYRRFEV